MLDDNGICDYNGIEVAEECDGLHTRSHSSNEQEIMSMRTKPTHTHAHTHKSKSASKACEWT